MTLSDSVNWPAVEAIGTVCAVVVALGLALWPAFWKRHTKPRLKLKVSGVEPHCIAIAGDGSPVHEVMLRVEVHNEGKRAAQQVSAKVTDMWIEDLPIQPDEFDLLGISPYISSGWRLRQSEPIALLWTAGPQVTIPPQASEFVCLVRLRRQDLELNLCMSGESLFEPKFEQSYARHRLRVFVFAEECEPSAGVIEFVVGGKHFISEVHLTSAPEKAEETRILTLLQRLSDSNDDPDEVEESTPIVP